MNTENTHLEALQNIKEMMERSSRFISLSGLSGIAAGTCALIGAAVAYPIVSRSHLNTAERNPAELISYNHEFLIKDYTGSTLFTIAACTLLAAICLASLFTYLRSKKTNTPIWSASSRRLTLNVLLPLVAGGIYLFRLLQIGTYGLIAPGCLIFYGLALLNASKYTLREVRYLGICEIILGIINLWVIGNGIYFWAFGFGILHILYGSLMWWKYERKQ